MWDKSYSWYYGLYKHTNTHTCTHTYIHIYTHALSLTHTRAPTHMCNHIYTYTNALTHTCPHTHTHVYIYIYILPSSKGFGISTVGECHLGFYLAVNRLRTNKTQNFYMRAEHPGFFKYTLNKLN